MGGRKMSSTSLEIEKGWNYLIIWNILISFKDIDFYRYEIKLICFLEFTTILKNYSLK